MDRTERFYRIDQLLNDKKIVPFSLLVEMLNLKAGHRERPVHLRQPYVAEKAGAKD